MTHNDTANSHKESIVAKDDATNTRASSAVESLLFGELTGKNHNYYIALLPKSPGGTTTAENGSTSYDYVPYSANSTTDKTVMYYAALETNTSVDEPVINPVTTQTNPPVANPIAHLNEFFEKNDNASTESSKRKLTSRKYSLRKSTVAYRFSNSLPQSEVPKPCNEEDIREEKVRYFIETWSEIKFDSKYNLFIGRNKE